MFKRNEPSLVGALCEMELEITHLDGWKLQVTISPGKTVQPMMQGLGPHWNDNVFGSRSASSSLCHLSDGKNEDFPASMKYEEQSSRELKWT